MIMAENSKIEWTDHTFNPWIGCTKVSDGCKYCYAETLMDKRYKKVQWGAQGKRVRTSAANWRKPLAWNRQAGENLAHCTNCGWRGDYAEMYGDRMEYCPVCDDEFYIQSGRYRVFCASLADVFEDKPDQPELEEWRWDLMELISKTTHLDWLLLTKRPESAAAFFDALYQDEESWINSPYVSIDFCEWMVEHGYDVNNPIPNIWIGTSVENQQQADKRTTELLEIPAAVRFLSMEPLLGNVQVDLDGINWVIIGGESGANARPMHPNWARAIRDQCNAAGVPFFFKQWGEFAPLQNLPADCSVRGMKQKRNWHWHEGKPSEASVRVGKKAAGRLLDGREWNEIPGRLLDGREWNEFPNKGVTQ